MSTYRVVVSIPWLPPPLRIRFVAVVDAETKEDAEREVLERYSDEMRLSEREIKVLETTVVAAETSYVPPTADGETHATVSDDH